MYNMYKTQYNFQASSPSELRSHPPVSLPQQYHHLRRQKPTPLPAPRHRHQRIQGGFGLNCHLITSQSLIELVLGIKIYQKLKHSAAGLQRARSGSMITSTSRVFLRATGSGCPASKGVFVLCCPPLLALDDLELLSLPLSKVASLRV
ncbi:hypothetical protein M9H77_36482 [Catharanthus roseus]|uniref:Uncharacterized protein n=1 Tax=Catharanthus roseus TaxID=4058 RepID=A0ACB9ZW66_CATRO|nr:hypothetical protein M9H77_36482 [Catharanthus roseus]